MDPLAQRQAAHRRQRQRHHQHQQKPQHRPMILRQPRRPRPHHKRKLTRNLKQNRRNHRQPIRPHIPRRHKPGRIPKRRPRPHIQPTLQRHLAIQVVNRHRHRHIKQHHRRNPDHRLRPPQSRRNPHPATAHHGQNLRQHQVPQRQLPRQRMALRRRPPQPPAPFSAMPQIFAYAAPAAKQSSRSRRSTPPTKKHCHPERSRRTCVCFRSRSGASCSPNPVTCQPRGTKIIALTRSPTTTYSAKISGILTPATLLFFK